MTTGLRATSGFQELTASVFDIQRIARPWSSINA